MAEGKARGDLAVGITEQNPNFLWAPGTREGVPPEFARWQDDMGKLKPSFFRLVLDWPSLQPEQGKPANLEQPYDGCLRGVPPCAGWAGVKDQLAALASRQKQHKGGWEVLVVITGSPDWAARPRLRLRARRHPAALARAEGVRHGRLPQARRPT